jgi:hypothetical protein
MDVPPPVAGSTGGAGVGVGVGSAAVQVTLAVFEVTTCSPELVVAATESLPVLAPV